MIKFNEIGILFAESLSAFLNAECFSIGNIK